MTRSLCIAIGLLLAQASGSFGQGVKDIIEDVTQIADGSFGAARTAASQQAVNGKLKYRSTKANERKTFTGDYRPPALPADKKGKFVYGLALFSDDGCDVTVDGTKVHGRLGLNQHLPDLDGVFATRPGSFYQLPVVLAPGKKTSITVDYSNTIYVSTPGAPGFPDIDGCTLFLVLIPVDIVPDDNMAGVLGDVVKSAKADSTIKHFVTPKKSTDLNQDYVELKAVGVDATQFNQMFTWEGGEVGSAANKRKVKRDTAGKTEVKVMTKQGNTVAVQMNVWVVWVDIALNQIRPATLQRVQVPTPSPPGLNGPGSSVQTVWDFQATIRPAIIITEPERPDLNGAPQTDVPNRNAKHPNDGAPFGQPAAKWDISRQMRCRVLSPQIGTNDMYDLKGLLGGTWYDNLPNANIIQPTTPNPGADSYPQNSVEGNDDGGAQAEDTDPYTAPNIGKLTDSDPPSQPFVIDQSPAVGSEIEFRLQFREFCRLEIGRTWFRISDHKPWRLHSKLKKTWVAAQDDADANGVPSGTEGQMRDNGSTSDATNNGW